MPLTPEQMRECADLKKLFIEKAGMSQRAFVKKYSLGSPANLGQYLQGRRALNVRIASTIAQALSIEVADFSPRLATEIKQLKSDRVEPVKSRLKKIPVVSFTQAGWPTDPGQEAMAATLIENGDYVMVDEELPDGTFATELKGDSMEPDFLAGDIIVIDPTIHPRPGDFVVARVDQHVSYSAERAFKKFRPKGVNENGIDVFELVPLNPDYPTIRSDRQPCAIIGVMVEHRRKYRRNHR